MAKIKFPLKMKDGAQVRTIEDLREHFDLESVLGYYDSGKLVEWLTDHYYDEEAGKIAKLDSNTNDFKQQLCNILGVDISGDEMDQVNLVEISGKNARLEKLKKITADDEILGDVEHVAFSQAELDELILTHAEKIYLVDNGNGTAYVIPSGSVVSGFNLSCASENPHTMMIIGLNKPLVCFDFHVDNIGELLLKLNCVFEGVRFDDAGVIEKAKITSDPIEAAKWWKKAAEAGFAEAQLELAKRFDRGVGVEESVENAFNWYLRAAEQGNCEAQKIVEIRYFAGVGVKRSHELAIEWGTKAAKSGDAEAQWILGMIYEEKAVSGDAHALDEADKWCSTAVKQGYVPRYIGYGYISDVTLKIIGEYMRKEKEVVRKAVVLNDIEAQRELFERCKELLLYDAAVYWGRKMLEKSDYYTWNYIKEMHHICYADDWGEYALFAQWLEKIAEQGYAWAQYALGEFYYVFNSYFIPVKDDAVELAGYWWKKAAEQGNTSAQCRLGFCYEHGIGVEEDEKEAVYWYQKAAEQGHAEAQYHLGVCYENGTGVEEDEEKAVYWYQQAAEQGDACARSRLQKYYT